MVAREAITGRAVPESLGPPNRKGIAPGRLVLSQGEGELGSLYTLWYVSKAQEFWYDPVFEHLVDQHRDVVGQDLRQQLVDLSRWVLGL